MPEWSVAHCWVLQKHFPRTVNLCSVWSGAGTWTWFSSIWDKCPEECHNFFFPPVQCSKKLCWQHMARAVLVNQTAPRPRLEHGSAVTHSSLAWSCLLQLAPSQMMSRHDLWSSIGPGLFATGNVEKPTCFRESVREHPYGYELC